MATLIPRLTTMILCAALTLGPAHAQTAATSAATLFQNRELVDAMISPTGTHVLARMTAPGERSNLVVLDLATMKLEVLERYKNADVTSAFWLSEKRIAFSVGHVDPGVIKGTAGLFARDLAGGGTVSVAEYLTPKRSFAATDGKQRSGVAEVIGERALDSDRLFVIVNYQEDASQALALLNTRTALQRLLEAPAGTRTWIVDENEKLRMAVAKDGKEETLQWLAINGNWRKVGTATTPSGSVLRPVSFVGNTLYVQSRNGGDKSQLFRYSVDRAGIDGGALVSSPEFDTDSGAQLVAEGGRLLGYRFLAEAEETVWFDKSMEALQKEVDELFPATVNEISRGIRSSTPYVLVRSSAPQQPVITRVYHRETRKMTNIGGDLPGVAPARMAASELKRYKARDALSIPVYVTLPPGSAGKNLPTIILVKPDSWVRGASWSFDPEVQFLASRGYAVIQPESRGTAGFGKAHLDAGRKQWGLAMQDDLADAAKWAVATGVADAGRICIAGSGYGGYAALMGLVKDASIFRCGISHAGIVDIHMMFEHDWKGAGTSVLEIKTLVGDPVQDKAQFQATSPLHNAARITRPVLLAYGAQDEAVPGAHGRALYDAIKPGNPAAEFHLFDEQGQSWSLEKNRVELWTRIEQFLAKNIGKP